jgi:hypothetical protein
MTNLKVFSTADLTKWFREESAIVLGRLIYMPPLARYSLNIILTELRSVHLEIERRGRSTLPFLTFVSEKNLSLS